MKYLIIFLFSSSAFGNYVAGSKVETLTVKIYAQKSVCELKESESCFQPPHQYRPETHKLVNGSIIEIPGKVVAYNAAQSALAAAKVAAQGRRNNVPNLPQVQKDALLEKALIKYLDDHKIDPNDL